MTEHRFPRGVWRQIGTNRHAYVLRGYRMGVVRVFPREGHAHASALGCRLGTFLDAQSACRVVENTVANDLTQVNGVCEFTFRTAN